MGLVRCNIKCKHLLKTAKIIRENVHMTAQEDMKHVLSYVGYMAATQELLPEFVKENYVL